MHSTLNRLQQTFSHLTTLAFCLAFLISFLSLVPINLPFLTPTNVDLPPPTATIKARNVQVVRGRPHYYSPKREEYAHIRFDLDADLSALFNWNTKQVFVYVSVEYPSATPPSTGLGKDGEQGTLPTTTKLGMNKAVIWDTIIPAPATRWSFQNVRERYFPAKLKPAGARKRSTSKSSGKEKEKTTDVVKPGLLTLKNQKPKYQITDPSGVISSRPNATLTLSWNVQPWVGPLLWDIGMLQDKNGGSVEQSWNLPFLRYRWSGLPRSETFEFPPLEGAAQKTPEVVKDREGPRTPGAASVTGVV
jgi:Signal peptidase subunit